MKLGEDLLDVSQFYIFSNKFLGSLNNALFPVTIRWSKGQDIDAGCGQLATGLKNN